MFSKLFQDDSEPAQKERAKLAFEKISSLKKDGGREARSARIRMVMLCRAHLDKSFVEGAEKAVVYDQVAMQAIVAGEDKPPPPTASEYLQVSSVSGDKVWVYLPQEYADLAFSLGASYQRTELSAREAIDAMQTLANQIFSMEFDVYDPFMVLQFLRDETGHQAGVSSSSDDNEEGEQETKPQASSAS